ncbi:AI-2E family transporter [Haloarchaeobius sp. HRN-SO-5]|uniref:AI-2E family transporter n=1 Tax=Haloarchaeobius sp. HRN-SO-5 TaxID=3446118 RepID=UPI003EBB5BCE
MDTSAVFKLVLYAVAAVVGYVLFAPYLSYILAAILVAYVLYPLYRRLAPRIGERLAALSSIVVFTIGILTPFLLLASALLDALRTILELIRERTLTTEVPDTSLGTMFDGAYTLGQFLSDGNSDVGLATIARDAVSLLGGLSDALIGLTILYFVLYYALVDGRALSEWVRTRTPLPEEQLDDIWEYADDLTFAAIVADISVAVVQGVLLGIGFFFVGLPGVVFWAVVTTLFAFLPIVGSFVVYIPASIYLFVTGRPLAGGLLLVYGLFFVSLIDNYLRPLIGGHAARMNPALVMIGIFGGLAVFGFLGVFYGPILLGLAKGVFELETPVD